MNRLVSLVMLAAFAVQQFACCCVGAGTHTCDQNPPSVAGQALGFSYTHSHAHGDEDHHHHHACNHEHDELPAGDDADPASDTGRPSHQHRVCVGTLVFFVSVSRFELPQQAFSPGLSFVSFDLAQHWEMAVCVAASHYGDGFGPPLSSCPQRSALCVYRI